jgi:hypothetical protein
LIKKNLKKGEIMLLKGQVVAVSLTADGKYEIFHNLLEGLLPGTPFSPDKVTFVVDNLLGDDSPATFKLKRKEDSRWEVKGGLNTIKKILRGLGKTVVC